MAPGEKTEPESTSPTDDTPFDTALDLDPSLTSVEQDQDGGASATVEDGAANAEPDPLSGDVDQPDHTGWDDLEEMVLPASAPALDTLPDGTRLGPEGNLRIDQLLGAHGWGNRYRATWHSDQPDAPETDLPVELREAPEEQAALRREAEVLGEVRYAMLPTLVATFVENGHRYVALDWRAEGQDAQTLEEALAAGLTPEQAVSIVIQLAQALRRIQQAGWALLGLTPADVRLGQPLLLTNLGAAARIGQPPDQPLFIAGYSAPELAYGARVTGKEDVFTLAAILVRALTGTPLPEQAAELLAVLSQLRTPGAPQLLQPALSTVDQRPSLEAFYQQLLGFRRRLGRASLGLQIASGTTIGLNPTRTVNEDACGFAQWTVADEFGARERAVLCMIDGMGGMEAGEVASQAALRAVLAAATAATTATTIYPSTLSTSPGVAKRPEAGDHVDRLDPVQLVQQAAAEVFTAAAGRSVGATISVVIVEDGVLTLGHVGDTRGYLLRDGELRQLTVDHSLVAAMVASGVLTEDQARHHPESNKVLRALGTHATLRDDYVDTLAAAWGEPELALRPGDQLLLCSDGVWGSVEDERLRDVLLEAIDGPTAVQVILRDALAAGAPDNASVIVARCAPVPGN